jgi:AcrR family transcriptional regulator
MTRPARRTKPGRAGSDPQLPLAPITPRPAPPTRSARQQQLAETARELLERDGAAAVTMRRLADLLGIAAPSLYKHVPGKHTLTAMLVEDALLDIGDVLHAALACAEAEPVSALLRAYRRYSLAHPHLYRLATGSDFRRDLLTPAVEQWAGEPFYLAVGDPYRAQALWAFAHGAVSLEIDNRFADASGLDRTWVAAASAFGR